MLDYFCGYRLDIVVTNPKISIISVRSLITRIADDIPTALFSSCADLKETIVIVSLMNSQFKLYFIGLLMVTS